MVLATLKAMIPRRTKNTLLDRLEPVIRRQARSLIDKGQATTFMVVAQRRSGHHAVMTWLASSLEGRFVDWKLDWCYLSPSGRTVLLNDFGRDVRPYDVLRARRNVSAAEFVFVNLENARIADLIDNSSIPRKPDFRVYVRRSLLNVVASQIQTTTNRGKTPSVVKLRESLETMTSNERNLHGWIVIDFDQWILGDPSYRSRLLNQFGGSFDCDPVLSDFGGGSSFTHLERLPAADELRHRFQQIEWPLDFVEALLDPLYRHLLQPFETDFLLSRRVVNK